MPHSGHTYHWKAVGGRLNKYRKAKKSGLARIPIDGNIYRILRRCGDGEKRMSWLVGSEFTAWDFEQCLVYGFISHELGKKKDCTLTTIGYNVFKHLLDLRHIESIEEPDIDTQHRTRFMRNMHEQTRQGLTAMVPCKVDEFWYQHFQERAW